MELESTETASDSFSLPFPGTARFVDFPTGLFSPLTFGLAVRSLELELVVDDLERDDGLEPLGVTNGRSSDAEGD